MIINKTALLKAAPIVGMLDTKVRFQGFSHGLTECGYDIRCAQDVWLFPGRSFALASSMELFRMPDHLMGRVLNKSTWARLGVDASMTTNIEPGWRGTLTIELRYSRWKPIKIPRGVGIAQVIFEQIKEPTRYVGKYQDQPAEPVPAILYQ
jgi:dCTP deaminase